MILQWALDISLVAVALAMALCGVRLLRGPSLPDRLLALDTLYISTVGLVVLLGLRLDTSLLFDVALLIAMLGFVSTVAVARFVTRGDVVE